MKLAMLVASRGLLAAGCEPVPATENTPAGGSPMPASIVEPYLKIETALAHDSMEGVRQNAGDLATALGSPAFRIDSYAAVMASAMELDDARDKFGRLSAVIVTYMDGLHLEPPEGVRIAFCPTNQKPWLQEGPALDNPYFGSAAPACGAFR